MKRTLINAERVKPRGHTSLEMKTRERNGSQGIRPIDCIMMHHGKRVENYTSPKRPALFVLRRAKNVAFWPRKGKASSSLSRRIVLAAKLAEILRYTRYSYLSTYLPTYRYVGILPFGRDGKPIPMLAHCTNSVLLAEEVDNVSNGDHNIAPRITLLERKSIPLFVLHQASFP